MRQRHDVVLVRHGQTAWSASGRHTGRTDLPLTEFGIRQAEALGAMVRTYDFAAVFASPLSRAWVTMERAGFGGVGIELPDLAEWDYGVYEGKTTLEIRGDIPGWSVWADEIIGGESVAMVGARADRVIDRVLAVDGPVALFAHGHLLRVLAARWVGNPPAFGAALSLDPATVSLLGWERENRVIRTWNEVCHLRPLDPPV
ncbi:MAG TPA: histidine phosphatase family protein [Acidimicrobiia bacterium]|nr:histidine phosphatase family protein [Acidimicrobiia bacterium]